MEKIITEGNAAEILASSKVVVVDFWATWCGPCRMLSPTVDEIAQECTKATVAKCNVDDCEELAVKYGIRSIPTIIYFKDGEPARRTVGVVSKQEILSIIDSLQ